MIIYLDEDNSYLSWVTHHHDGFVIAWQRQPTRTRPVLHRASCPRVRHSKSKKTHWTSGRHLKACSLDFAELTQWASTESGDRLEFCDACEPQQNSCHDQQTPHDLTALEKDILDYVLEITIIHLDSTQRKYELTLENIADYLNKTPRQLGRAVRSLLQHGELERDVVHGDDAPLSKNERLFATPQSLRRETAFQEMPAAQMQAELRQLRR